MTTDKEGADGATTAGEGADAATTTPNDDGFSFSGMLDGVKKTVAEMTKDTDDDGKDGDGDDAVDDDVAGKDDGKDDGKDGDEGKDGGKDDPSKVSDELLERAIRAGLTMAEINGMKPSLVEVVTKRLEAAASDDRGGDDKGGDDNGGDDKGGDDNGKKDDGKNTEPDIFKKLGIDEQEIHPGLAKAIKSLNETLNNEIKTLKDELAQERQSVREQRGSEFVTRLDSMVAGLDKSLHDELGKGSMDDLFAKAKGGDKAAANALEARIRIGERMDLLAQGARSRKERLTESEAFEQAVASLYPKKLADSARRKLADAVNKRAGRTSARPGERVRNDTGGGKTDDRSVISAVDAWRARTGVGA